MTEIELDAALPGAQKKSEIPRRESGLRLLKTLLFVLIFHAVELVLAALILFQLAWTLITQQPASERVRSFARHVITYAREILEYVTDNRREAPFPFADLPTERS